MKRLASNFNITDPDVPVFTKLLIAVSQDQDDSYGSVSTSLKRIILRYKCTA